jgi:uncharacterized protein (TIGR00255 family)
MTGFGAGAAESAGRAVRVEVRSVNHRHLQIKTRLPAELVQLETALEGVVKKTLERGSVTVTVSLERKAGRARGVIDAALAKSYHKQLVKLAREVGVRGDVDLGTLVGLPGVVGGPDAGAHPVGTPGPAEEKLAQKALREALAGLVDMREKEGKHLAADLERNARAITRITAKIEKRMPIVVRQHHESLTRRVNELLEGRSVVQEADLARELALLADRMDVREELARLASHLAQFDALLAAGGSAGRKLEFLVQELFREANTIGSKCNDTTVAHAVVDIKTHVERLREQVQNVE